MKNQSWIVSIYNDNFDVIKPLRFVVGSFEKAEKTCQILQHHHPKKNIMFDHA